MEPGQRKKWTAEEKLKIVLEGMRGDLSISDVYRKHGVNTTLYYTWRDKVYANAEKLFGHGNQKPSFREQELEMELAKSKEVVNELLGSPPVATARTAA